MKLVPIEKKDTIELNSKIDSFLSPEFVYFPISDKNDKKKRVQKGESFFGGVASVSGILTGVEKCLVSTGKIVPCVVLKNDFQEKMVSQATRKKIVNLTKEEILEGVFSNALKEKLNNDKIKTIVISGIDLEPFIANETFIQKEHLKSLLETIDMLLRAYRCEKAFIAISNLSSELITYYNDFLGTYKNITLKMVPDLYMIGEELFLTRYLHIKEAYLFLKTTEVYSLYYQLKKRRVESEKYITISGDFSNEIKGLLVKLGTKVKDVLEQFYSPNLEAFDVYVNGVMRGKKLELDSLIVTDDFSGLVIMKKEKRKDYDCIKCGKCNAVCPIHSNPIMAYKGVKKVKCIDCGLCSYVCPSNIPLRKYLRGENDE